MWEKFKGLIFIGGQSSMNVSYKLYLKSKDSKSVHAVGFNRCFCPSVQPQPLKWLFCMQKRPKLCIYLLNTVIAQTSPDNKLEKISLFCNGHLIGSIRACWKLLFQCI